MVQITQLKVLVFACVIFTAPSSAEAIQWPVNAGPIHQSVPQYRARYPLFKADAPDPNLQNQQPLRRALDAIKQSEPEQTRELQLRAPATQDTTSSLQLNLPATRDAASMPAKPSPSPQTQTPQMIRNPLDQSANKPAESNPTAKLPAVSKKQKSKTKQRVDKKTAATKKKQPNPPVISYDIYRDRNPLPIDPRKPCGICTNPNRHCGCGNGCRAHCDAPGLHGKPYQEREPGACRCGDKKLAKSKPMFSQYWPRPFSAKLDEHFPQQAADRYRPCQKKRIVDAFDKFADFKLIDYQRKDNGYCGEDSDPYGCLGESRIIASGVAGVGYRFPSVPVDRSAARASAWR